jgi:2-polyprenyl-3-methyl-5-hydroxy-6-metoxy-1,4-benzoquinol methylase
MEMAADLVRQARMPGQPVVDLGCNGGHLLELIGKPCWGYDIARSPLAVAFGNGHDARWANIATDELQLAPVVAICEVLEHLENPHAVVARLNVDPVRFVVASGPYRETAEDHYEQHLWAWDEEGFAKLFTDVGFNVVKQTTSGIFQAILLARV